MSWKFAACLAFAAASSFAQPPHPIPAKDVPRAADGHPDLSGVWTNATITPFERPAEFRGKEYMTEQEASAYEKSHVFDVDTRTDKGSTRDVNNAYNSFWWDRGSKLFPSRRTSIVIDPPDGRVPAQLPERQAVLRDQQAARRKRCEQPGCGVENSGILAPADGPEDRPLMERCISFGNVAPMLSTAYNNNYEIVQTPGFVGIEVEMVHQMRRFPIDATPHLPSSVRFWFGDSRARWEGDTLVIDTTNFDENYSYRGSDKNLHLIETLTRIDENQIVYRFTVDDPTVFTKQWTGEVIFTKSQGLLYEYACHEGNFGLSGILGGARADEREAAAKAAKGTK